MKMSERIKKRIKKLFAYINELFEETEHPDYWKMVIVTWFFLLLIVIGMQSGC